MASQILFDTILNEYQQIISGNATIVPPGSNVTDFNIKVVAIVPASVNQLSAITGNVLTFTSTDGTFTSTVTSPSVSASNCASKKLIIK